jgi:hypothetical protein
MNQTSVSTSVASSGVAGALVILVSKILTANHVVIDNDTMLALLVIVMAAVHIVAAVLGPKSAVAAVLDGTPVATVVPGTVTADPVVVPVGHAPTVTSLSGNPAPATSIITNAS